MRSRNEYKRICIARYQSGQWEETPDGVKKKLSGIKFVTGQEWKKQMDLKCYDTKAAMGIT